MRPLGRDHDVQMRGDHKTYASESYGFAMDPAGNGPIATAARTGKTQFILNAGAPDERALRTRGLKMKSPCAD